MLLEDTDSPQGGGTAYWPRSHLANHRYFLRHPERIDGSYLFEEPVKSRAATWDCWMIRAWGR